MILILVKGIEKLDLLHKLQIGFIELLWLL